MKMLKFKVELELDEETMKEMFESQEIKFTKKKISEIKDDLKENFCDYESELLERFQELISDFIINNFE
jgi:hypothetical protein